MSGLLGRPAFEQFGIVFIDLDELDEAFDAEVGERLDAVFANAKDPDWLRPRSPSLAVSQPIFVFAEAPRDLGDGGEVMDFVDVGCHAARAEIADAGVQFQGRSSSSR